MKTISYSLVALGFWAAIGIFADDNKFEGRKARSLKEIEERIVRLAEYKKCVSSATQQERLKACYEKMTLWRAAEDAKRQEFQKEEKDTFFEDLLDGFLSEL